MSENSDDSLEKLQEKKLNSLSNEKLNRRSYKQIYRKDWENNPIFKGWLSPVSCDKHKAECIACHKELLAHRLTLIKHASSAKHFQKVSLMKNCNKIKKKESTMEITKSGSDYIEKNLDISPQLSEISFKSISGDSSVSGNNDLTVESNQLNHNNDLLTISTRQRSINATKMFEDDASNIKHGVFKHFTKTSNNSNYTPENITNIITETESFENSSGSNNALNVEQDYTSKDDISFSTKKNNAVMSASYTNTFLTEINNSPNENINIVKAYPLQVSTRVTDYSKGISVSDLNISLCKLISGKWFCVSESVTDEIGRCNLFPKNENFFDSGCYKLHFDVTTYYEMQNIKSYFPFIEVVFTISSPDEVHHIPLMISPNGYTTYRSSEL